jgi:hypothetical protein
MPPPSMSVVLFAPKDVTMADTSRYAQIIATIFHRHYEEGATAVTFSRPEITEVANELGIELPKNLGDVIYTFKFRQPLPASVQRKAPTGTEWIIAGKGRSTYAFEARKAARIFPDEMLVVTKIPDATPGVVASYSLDDEQALLAKLRYNRLIDIFTGVAAYSLQNHLRTSVNGIGQVETDELYIGIDKKGEHYVFPVQAKGGSDELGIVQIEQDLALCALRFPGLTCRPIAAQFMGSDVIALMEMGLDSGEIRKVAEKHYSLVPHEQVTAEDLLNYRDRTNS